MNNFGLPEVLMLFEVWQRSPEFLMKQVQMADVMKRSAESLLDLFTGCFSGGCSIPELGLGNAETKVVATAWNRHLLLFNNAKIYKSRSGSFDRSSASMLRASKASLSIAAFLRTLSLN